MCLVTLIREEVVDTTLKTAQKLSIFLVESYLVVC